MPTRRSKTRDLEEALAAANERIRALEGRAREIQQNVDGVICGPCTRCGYGPWRARQAPVACPRCRSAYWNRQRVRLDARRPEDPPRPGGWEKQRPRVRGLVTVPTTTTAQSPAAVRPITIALEVEDGSPIVPPPPRLTDVLNERIDKIARTDERIAEAVERKLPQVENEMIDIVRARTTENPMRVEHVATMPDSIVKAILEEKVPTYDEIKAAKADPGDNRTDRADPAPQERDARPRSAKVAAFFADAEAAGLVTPLAELDAKEAAAKAAREADPFIAPSLAPVQEDDHKDDPFWK